MALQVTTFFDTATFTATHVAEDPATGHCAVIDPVLDYDPASGRTDHHSADRVVAHIREHGLTVGWILETHVHADHLTASPYLKAILGGKTAIGDKVTVVQETFARLFNAEPEFATDGRQFDRLLGDGETFMVGSIPAKAIHTPGHTPACMTYVVGDAAFVGDTLFMPDYGTARCDFPGGDARTLYRSLRKILSLPDETRMYLCHDYRPLGRDTDQWETTVAEQRRANVHIREEIGEDEFVAMRQRRDAGLAMPVLILPSVQVNMRAGEMPPAEANGQHYLKIPVDAI
ncbi:MAG TPA: MBL fold metallo-hydrolase [Patescibacteria group bacterium]|nr:MBL fold metallo-hydrolase [Patescibacteria group bacterium]